jgi:hypothetical protein
MEDYGQERHYPSCENETSTSGEGQDRNNSSLERTLTATCEDSLNTTLTDSPTICRIFRVSNTC